MIFPHVRKRAILFLLIAGMVSCRKTETPAPAGTDTTGEEAPVVTFDINSINDTYADVAPFVYYPKWGPYNVHDPIIRKFGDYYYCYSTDVGYGISVRPGLQIRKSKDLVEWTFVGWVFDKIPSIGASFIQQRGGTPNNSLWAPSVLKVGNEYRLYYSLASNVGRLSVVGLATATSPEGPWTEKGLVVTSLNDNSIQTNAIDPSVLVTSSGDHWMYYGSAWDGIYALKLNASTGLAQTSNDKGKRIANRGFTAGKYNGNIEGPEVIYNPAQNKYFLFIAYDWLETKYNTRVMRGDNPDGPFYDFKGTDANTNVDHGPMITAPYQFNGHGGWQGVSHCTVFDDGNGQYYLAHQGRPGAGKYFMDLHVRKVFWTSDGWPIVSPERYAWENNANVPVDSITGAWEQIILGYRVVPGYADEQVSPDFQVSIPLTISANGTLNNDPNSKWTYTAPWLEMKWSNGFTDKVLIQMGRDWEKKTNTFIFTGLNNDGTAIWGKKSK
ncbi:arabinan endo-1,5-alpha-L-arabinosidase [Chitinophaga tropicalis]|uniref:Family 43 glycosylhydrolase n=1 Tax=Chitinophaga tropicalis TaxID=2683588 RepID=A0A7K1U0J2_9BACT|nr:arabinan endo-1,5-alpha-L-arabinosidase [Chitinophaga tropicalis]MVT07863.1 family 43 glycosylhydrolase [Chitinophaga tropicalis]